jgi:hypothetical protein
MSSDIHLRQIPGETTYYDAQHILTGLAPSLYIFEFVPVVSGGNYPPGYVQFSPILFQTIVDTVAANGGPSNFVLRDMGKTIFAPQNSITGPYFAYYRQVQLFNPGPIPLSGVYNNQLGGPGGSTYGVLGANATPDAYTNYLTFYIPIVMMGIGYLGATSAQAYTIAGGQM